MKSTNVNLNEATSVAQTKLIAAHLLAGHTITQQDAYEAFKCFRLASRINDLRNKGYGIKTTTVVTTTGKRVAEYSMTEEERERIKNNREGKQ